MLRKTPAQLIKEATSKGRSDWYEQLSLEDQEYICKVVEEMKKNPNAALTFVAKQLIDVLSIKRSIVTVTHTLRGMIRDG